jgi:hypothetical protein
MQNSCETSDDNLDQNKFRIFTRKYKLAIGIVIGGLAGFLYYTFVGCTSGSCALASNPVSSTLIGGLLGLVFVKRPCSVC